MVRLFYDDDGGRGAAKADASVMAWRRGPKKEWWPRKCGGNVRSCFAFVPDNDIDSTEGMTALEKVIINRSQSSNVPNGQFQFFQSVFWLTFFAIPSVTSASRAASAMLPHFEVGGVQKEDFSCIVLYLLRFFA